MTITSLSFFLFLIVAVIGYYVCPAAYRWAVLLICSAAFLFVSSRAVSVYTLVAALVAYIAARLIRERCKTASSKKITLAVGILAEIALFLFLRYCSPSAPLGVAYYTLTLIAYLADAHRETADAERNFFKLSLFTCYFPCMVSGPILRYPEMQKGLFGAKKADPDDLFLGFDRIVYGLMKKLLIADNVAACVNVIFADTTKYAGYMILLGVAMYTVQIYCDFSGCMDIAIGASRLFGVRLPENFNAPLFSKNLTEFWRRWHMSLGAFGKDYIMYPLQRSDAFRALGDRAKKRFGKKAGKKLPMIAAIFVLWALIGFWHGPQWNFIFATGVLLWCFFAVGILCEGLFQKLTGRLHIDRNAAWFHIFQSLRTLAVMCVVWMFLLSPSLLETGATFRALFSKPAPRAFSLFLWEVIGDTTRQAFLGRYGLVAFAFCWVLHVDYRKYKEIDFGDRFLRRALMIRYVALLAMIIATICFGVYGPGYRAVDFIYGGF